MPGNTSPIFGLTPNNGRARVTAANTASDGSGSLTDLITGGTNGTRVDRIKYRNSQATAAASSAMIIRLFITDAAGANPRLYDEFALATATRSTTAVGAGGTYIPANGIILASGQKLQVIQSVYAGVQDQMDYVAEGVDF